MEVAAPLRCQGGHPPPPPRRPRDHPPLGCRISMRKVKGYQRRDVEFFVNSQAVCLSLPMIRSLRCLRNAKGPSPSPFVRATPQDSSRRSSSSLTCTRPSSSPLASPPAPPLSTTTTATTTSITTDTTTTTTPSTPRLGPGLPSGLSGQIRRKPPGPRRFNIPARVI